MSPFSEHKNTRLFNIAQKNPVQRPGIRSHYFWLPLGFSNSPLPTAPRSGIAHLMDPQGRDWGPRKLGL